jgi:protein gp37
MVPNDWPFAHVGIMATMVNDWEFQRDWWKLRMVPAPWRGISAEPLLDRIFLDGAGGPVLSDTLHWVITGGESGPDYRPLDMGAVRHLRDQCREIGIAFHHKQNGGVRDNGCLVDGVEHKNFPAALAA